MSDDAGRWTALLARVATEGEADLAEVAEARLRRQFEKRMQVRGLRSAEEYVRLLQRSPGEYLALLGAAQSLRLPGSGQTHRRQGSLALRRWIESVPVPALAAEGVSAAGGLRLLASNRAARALFGRAQEALHAAGESHQWFLPDRTPCRDEDLPLHEAIWHHTTAENGHYILREASGRERSLIVDAAPMPGRRLRAIATIRLAAAPSAVEGAPEDRYGRLFEEAPVPVILTARNGSILEANARARAMLHAHEQELVNAPLSGLLADESLAEYREALASLAHSGRAKPRLALLAQPDLVLEVHAREVQADEPLIQWVLHDVTPFVATDRMRRDLIDLLLHDLRSPLATSSLGIEAAERGLERGDERRARRSLTIISTALRRLSRLVDSLLDLSRLEAGHPIIRAAEMKPAKMLADVAAEVEPALAPQSLDLQLEVASDLPAIVADGDMLFRVVINLLDNAIKFSPPEGTISLTAAAQDRGLLICVTDQGPGIPRDLQPRIFDKFVGRYLPNAPRGYGLGLAFCKLAVEAHGGWLAVDSVPDHGSTFALWVPTRPS